MDPDLFDTAVKIYTTVAVIILVIVAVAAFALGKWVF